jgi:hypothetical protein
MLPGGYGSDQASLAAQHGRGRGGLPPGRAPLMVALGAKLMLEVVVGARQIRDRVAVEQPRTVATGDLAEVVDGAAETARAVTVTEHGANHSVEAALHRGSLLGLRIGQDVGRLVHPRIDPLDVGPQPGRLLQATLDQILETRERRRAPPFSATRSRLSATASSRPLSFRPDAASGGWPSSVMALRTAAQ